MQAHLVGAFRDKRERMPHVSETKLATKRVRTENRCEECAFSAPCTMNISCDIRVLNLFRTNNKRYKIDKNVIGDRRS